jgi:hypothetical protein
MMSSDVENHTSDPSVRVSLQMDPPTIRPELKGVRAKPLRVPGWVTKEWFIERWMTE